MSECVSPESIPLTEREKPRPKNPSVKQMKFSSAEVNYRFQNNHQTANFEAWKRWRYERTEKEMKERDRERSLSVVVCPAGNKPSLWATRVTHGITDIMALYFFILFFF